MSRALIVLHTPSDRERAAAWARNAPVETRVVFQAPKRSLEQNALLWAALTDVATQVEHMGKRYTPDEWKILFMHACGREVRFLPGLDGKTFVPWGQSSSDLSKQEMSELIDFIFAWGAEHGVTFRDQSPTSDAPPPGIPSSDAGGDDPTSSPDITADQSALVGGSAEEEEAAVSQKGKTVSPDQQKGSDDPGPASSSADRAELIDKFLEIASNDLAPQERVDIMKDALPDWCAKIDSDFVRAVYQTAVKVVKGELKPDAARKYLEAIQ